MALDVVVMRRSASSDCQHWSRQLLGHGKNLVRILRSSCSTYLRKYLPHSNSLVVNRGVWVFLHFCIGKYPLPAQCMLIVGMGSRRIRLKLLASFTNRIFKRTRQDFIPRATVNCLVLSRQAQEWLVYESEVGGGERGRWRWRREGIRQRRAPSFGVSRSALAKYW